MNGEGKYGETMNLHRKFENYNNELSIFNCFTRHF